MNEEPHSSGTDDPTQEEKCIDPEVWKAINLVNRNIWHPKADKEKVTLTF